MRHRILVALWLAQSLLAQSQESVFRAETKLLAVDVIVRDAATGQPTGDLAVTDFQLRIDGKERPIAYFAHAGDNRRPLALLVFFNLAPEGGLRQLSMESAQASFRAALARLNPDDEVAVYAAGNWFVGEGREISALGSDREDSIQALEAAVSGQLALSAQEHKEEGRSRARSMESAVARALEIAALRPQSQVAIVQVSDGMNTLDTMKTADRRDLAALLTGRNVSLSALNLRMSTTYSSAAAVLNPMGKLFGVSVTGGAGDLSRQTGGVAFDVPGPAELGEGFDKILRAYSSRYFLGYKLGESEFTDGRSHRIEVSLRGAAAAGRKVSARKTFVDR